MRASCESGSQQQNSAASSLISNTQVALSSPFRVQERAQVISALRKACGVNFSTKSVSALRGGEAVTPALTSLSVARSEEAVQVFHSNDSKQNRKSHQQQQQKQPQMVSVSLAQIAE